MTPISMSIKYLVLESTGSVLRWPYWWYTHGLVLAGKSGIRMISGYAEMLSIRVWIKNIFVPMFGMYDWQSRIISVFMRIVQIIGRGIALVIMTIIVLFLLVVYVTLPVIVIVAAAYNFIGSIS